MVAAGSPGSDAHSLAENSRAASNCCAVRSVMNSRAASAPNRSAKMPARMVGVVQEQQQVAEADQRVGAVTGAPQRVSPAVHVADHVDPH